MEAKILHRLLNRNGLFQTPTRGFYFACVFPFRAKIGNYDNAVVVVAAVVVVLVVVAG